MSTISSSSIVTNLYSSASQYTKTSSIIIYAGVGFVVFSLIIVAFIYRWKFQNRHDYSNTDASHSTTPNNKKHSKVKKGKKNKKTINHKSTGSDTSSKASNSSFSSPSKNAHRDIEEGSEKASLMSDDGTLVMSGANELRRNSSESDHLISSNKPIIDDAALLKIFETVLQEGMVVNLHTIKGSKEVKLNLVGNEIRWKTLKSTLARKVFKINLADVMSVESGKTTPNFRKPSANGTSEDLCFSLVTDKISLDLEVSSKIERDAMLYGFTAKVAALHQLDIEVAV